MVWLRDRQRGVRGAPAVPSGHAAVRAVRLAERFEFTGGRRGIDAMDASVSFSDTEVVDGPDVEPPELEDQEHLGGPGADPFDERQLSDDLVVGEPRHP